MTQVMEANIPRDPHAAFEPGHHHKRAEPALAYLPRPGALIAPAPIVPGTVHPTVSVRKHEALFLVARLGSPPRKRIACRRQKRNLPRLAALGRAAPAAANDDPRPALVGFVDVLPPQREDFALARPRVDGQRKERSVSGAEVEAEQLRELLGSEEGPRVFKVFGTHVLWDLHITRRARRDALAFDRELEALANETQRMSHRGTSQGSFRFVAKEARARSHDLNRFGRLKLVNPLGDIATADGGDGLIEPAHLSNVRVGHAVLFVDPPHAARKLTMRHHLIEQLSERRALGALDRPLLFEAVQRIERG